MMKFIASMAVAVALAAPVLAQDPTKTLPGSYRVELDNDFVTVVRVHYDAGARLPDHTHPGGTTVYVYLNESEGVVFQHSSGSNRPVTRPPVKAGGIRIASGPEEHHAVENTSKLASDFLRIYLKTGTGRGRGVRRLTPDETSFSDANLRISRLRLEQHDVETIDAKTPALLVEWPSGNVRWVAAGTTTTAENHDPEDRHFIRIDLLTTAK